MHIGLVSTDEGYLHTDPDTDLDLIMRQFAARGLSVQVLIWHQWASWPDVDVLIWRSPWDYADRMAEFTRFLAAIPPQVRILNPPELIRWNLDKRYLVDLSARGVPITPTRYCGQITDCVGALAEHGDQLVVIKPNISAASRATGLMAANDPAALDLCRHIRQLGKTVLIQPAISEIQQGAERALVYFNGQFSHAVSKGAILAPGGGYLGGRYTEQIAAAQASAAEIDLGTATLAAIAQLAQERGWGSDAGVPLQARIDVVTPADGPPLLIEAELFEPALFLGYHPGAPARYVAAVAGKLRH